MKFTRTINYAAQMLKAKAPRLLTAAGVIGIPVSIVLACKATRKLDETLEECTIDRKDTRSLVSSYAHAGLKLGELYGPAALVASTSIFCILKSDNIDQKNYAVMTATAEGIYATYLKYRENNRILNGEEADKKCIVTYRESAYDVEDPERPGEFKPAVDCQSISDSARFFDEYSSKFNKYDREANKQLILDSANWVRRKLRTKGFLSAYDYYKYLGIVDDQSDVPESLHILGWEYGDEIDLGIWQSPHIADFINLREQAVLLDPNFKVLPTYLVD